MAKRVYREKAQPIEVQIQIARAIVAQNENGMVYQNDLIARLERRNMDSGSAHRVLALYREGLAGARARLAALEAVQ